MRYIWDVQRTGFEAAVLTELQAVAVRKHKTLPVLAAEIGCDYNTFWRYIKGRRTMPLPILLATLDALGVDEAEFMREAKRQMSK